MGMLIQRRRIQPFGPAKRVHPLAFAGGVLGGRVPGISCRAAGIAGGAVLCCIGVRLLLEGIGVL